MAGALAIVLTGGHGWTGLVESLLPFALIVGIFTMRIKADRVLPRAVVVPMLACALALAVMQLCLPVKVHTAYRVPLTAHRTLTSGQCSPWLTASFVALGVAVVAGLVLVGQLARLARSVGHLYDDRGVSVGYWAEGGRMREVQHRRGGDD